MLAVIQLADRKGYEKSPGEDELLLHFSSHCIIPLFQPFFFFFFPLDLLARKAAQSVPPSTQPLQGAEGIRPMAKWAHACHCLPQPPQRWMVLGRDSDAVPGAGQALTRARPSPLGGGMLEWSGSPIALCCGLEQPLESLGAVVEVPNI